MPNLREVTSKDIEDAMKPKDIKKLIDKISSPYSKSLSCSQIDSCALMAMWNTLRKHDYTKRKFTSSFCQFLIWELIRELKNIRKHTTKDKVGNVIAYCSNREPERPETLIDLHDSIDALPEKCREIVRDFYIMKKTVTEIAKEKHLSRTNVRNLLRKGVEGLKELCS